MQGSTVILERKLLLHDIPMMSDHQFIVSSCPLQYLTFTTKLLTLDNHKDSVLLVISSNHSHYIIQETFEFLSCLLLVKVANMSELLSIFIVYQMLKGKVINLGVGISNKYNTQPLLYPTFPLIKNLHSFFILLCSLSPKLDIINNRHWICHGLFCQLLRSWFISFMLQSRVKLFKYMVFTFYWIFFDLLCLLWTKSILFI